MRTILKNHCDGFDTCIFLENQLSTSIGYHLDGNKNERGWPDKEQTGNEGWNLRWEI